MITTLLFTPINVGFFMFVFHASRAACCYYTSCAHPLNIRIKARAMALRNYTAFGLAVYCLGTRAGRGRAPTTSAPLIMSGDCSPTSGLPRPDFLRPSGFRNHLVKSRKFSFRRKENLRSQRILFERLLAPVRQSWGQRGISGRVDMFSERR